MAKGTPKNLPAPKGKILGLGALSKIPDEDIALLQRGVFNVVKQNLPRVREVLEGRRNWNPQQVKLYLAMLSKVMPDLKQEHHTHDHQNLDEMSPDMLRQIIAEETAKAAALDAIPKNDPDIPFDVVIAQQMNDPLILSDVPTEDDTP